MVFADEADTAGAAETLVDHSFAFRTDTAV
jgi:hypothetical protein